MREPRGFLLTWHTYGTWLHGDERGSVDRLHNAYGTPLLVPDPDRFQWVTTRMRADPVTLNHEQQSLVARSLAETARRREWELLASAVRTNHVHLVVALADLPPERMLTAFKNWSTRALRAAGCFLQQPVWVVHGSTRYLWNDRSLRDACTYVLDGQDVPR